MNIFADCVGLQTLFRAWDVLIIDGFDVLFRLALSILRIGESELLACISVPAAYVALESLPTRMWEADRLLQVSSIVICLCQPDSQLTFGQMEADLRGNIVHSELVKRRGVHVQALEAALAGV